MEETMCTWSCINWSCLFLVLCFSQSVAVGLQLQKYQLPEDIYDPLFYGKEDVVQSSTLQGCKFSKFPVALFSSTLKCMCYSSPQ